MCAKLGSLVFHGRFLQATGCGQVKTMYTLHNFRFLEGIGAIGYFPQVSANIFSET